MQAKRIKRLRKIIDNPNYLDYRIDDILLKVDKLKYNYFKRSDFSAISKWIFDCEYNRLNRKLKWYLNKKLV